MLNNLYRIFVITFFIAFIIEKAETPCAMMKQGYSKSAYEVTLKKGSMQPACKATLKFENE